MTLSSGVPRALRTWSPLIDQFLVGAASGILLIAGAATMDPDELGQFGFAYSVVAVIAVVWRGGFLARLSLIEGHSDLLSRLRKSLLAVIATSPFSIVAVLALVWQADGREGLTSSTVIVCLSLPVVLIYEGLRQALIAANDARWPLVTSTVWLVASAGTLGAAWYLDSVLLILLVWLGAGVIGCVVLWSRADFVSARRIEADDSGVNRGFALPSIQHFNVVAALPAVASLGIAAVALSVAGPTVMAEIVVLNAVLYPLSVYTQAVPLLARTLRRQGVSGSRVAAFGVIVGASLWFAAVTWVFPDFVAVLFGESWDLASGLLWIATLNLLAGALVAIEIARLHRLGISRPIRLVVLCFSPVRVVAAWIAASLTGSAGWIIAVEFALHALMWLTLRLSTRNA